MERSTAGSAVELWTLKDASAHSPSFCVVDCLSCGTEPTSLALLLAVLLCCQEDVDVHLHFMACVPHELFGEDIPTKMWRDSTA